MIGLDKLDRKILFELDRNSRQPLSELARRVRQGRDRVAYRIERLEDQEIIKTYVTSVNLYQLGLTIYKTYIRVENNSERVPAFVRYLRKHPRVYWYCLCDGGWDIMIAVLARSPQEFHTLHHQMLSEFNDIILDFRVYTLIDVCMYRKNYFQGKGKDYFLVGGELEYYRLDNLDYELLKQLSENARAPIAELAATLETTPAVIRYRIEKLEELEIIVGYRIDVNLEKLGMLAFKAQLFLNNYSEAALVEFHHHCTANPHITYFIRQIGECTLELELAVDTYQQYHQCIDEIRSKFSRLIRNFNSVLMRKQEYKWVPRDITVE